MSLEKPQQPEQEKFLPEIEFILNPQNDKSICLMFWRNHIAAHPALKHILETKDEETAKQEIEKFINTYYKENSEVIQQKFLEGQQEWSTVSNVFFTKVNEMFHGYDWPMPHPKNQGKYRAAGSILKRWPRNIQRQFFSFPASPDFPGAMAKQVIAHEMLHFITYDYLEKKYGLKPSEFRDPENPDNKNYDNTFWQFTETLNAIIEEDEMWQEFIPSGSKLRRKPECEEMYKKMKPVWDQNKDIDNLIQKILIEPTDNK